MMRLLLFVFSIFVYANLFAAQPHPLIESLVIDGQTIRVKIARNFSAKYLKGDSFFVEYPSELNISSLDYSIASIPFVLTVAPIIWVSNTAYAINEMDEDLYHALKKLQIIFKALFPSSSWKGSFEPKKLIKHTFQPAQYHHATLFSGGLDAVYSALMHAENPQLLITIWGGDVKLSQETMWHEVKKKCSTFAQQYDKDHTWCKSNFRELLDDNKLNILCSDIGYWWGYTSQAFNYIGLIAPITYLKQIPLIYIGSSHTVEYPDPYGSHPLIDNAITFASTRVIHDGADRNRIEKLTAIDTQCKEKKLATPYLRVCWGHDAQGGNCLNCEKCLRTIIELLIAGINPTEYGLHFNHFIALSLREQIGFLKTNYSALTAYHWQMIKKEALANNRIQNPEIKQLLDWLLLQPIRMPIDKKNNSSRANALKILWNKCLSNNFSLQDLAILTATLQNKKN